MKPVLFSLLVSGFLISLAFSWDASVKPKRASSGQSTTKIDEIILEQWGPASSPQFSTNFTITLNRDLEKILVDSFKTPSIDIEKKLSKAEFDQLLAQKDSYQIVCNGALPYDGCLGAKGQTLVFQYQGALIMEGSISTCSGKKRSSLEGNFLAFIEAIKKITFSK